jgi:hypothetical protein
MQFKMVLNMCKNAVIRIDANIITANDANNHRMKQINQRESAKNQWKSS